MDTAARLAPALAFLFLLLGQGPVPSLLPLSPAAPGPAALAGTAADDPPPLTPVRDPTPAEPPPPQDTMIVLRAPPGSQRA